LRNKNAKNVIGGCGFSRPLPSTVPLLVGSFSSRTIIPATRMGSIRSFHITLVVLKKKKDDDDEEEGFNLDDEDDEEVQFINSGDLSEPDMLRILEQEEEKMAQEERSKYVDNWKPGMRKRPLQIGFREEDFVYYEPVPDGATPPEPRWSLRDKRCGALAIKVGMLPVFDDWGVRHPCTVLYLDNNVVLGHKTYEQHGYLAMQIAAGQRKRKNVGGTVLGQYKAILEENEHPPYMVREFRITDESLLLPINSRIHARHFCPGQNIDVSGISKGKGFQGAMKRHNFGGMPASHGVSRSHRSLGATGQCQDPGKVFKGKKMAGQMGAERVTVQNLRIIKIDRGRNLLYIEGAVPGNKGNFVEIRDAVKKPLWRTEKVAGALDRPPLPTFEYDEAIDGCGQPYEEWMPLPGFDPFSPDLDEDAA